jgi:F-type H+-transporting ATPase subunit epsilon
MADTFQFQLVSPERMLVDEQVSEAQIPAAEGYIGVMPGHAPLMSELKPGGVLTYKGSGGEKTLAVYGGFVEVLPERTRVLADAAEFSTEINADKARQRLAEATKAMEKPADDPAPALAELAQAQAAVDAASKH